MKSLFLAKDIETSVSTCETLVKTACLLHNIIIEEESQPFHDFEEQMGDKGIYLGQGQQENVQRASRGTNISHDIRNKFMMYFTSPEGDIQWQRNCINYSCYNYHFIERYTKYVVTV